LVKWHVDGADLSAGRLIFMISDDFICVNQLK